MDIQPGDKVVIKYTISEIRGKIQAAFNVIIIVFVGTGTSIMMNNTTSGSGLTAVGFENFKFFTVLSNELCGVVAVLWLIFWLINKSFPAMLKLITASAVGLTFLIIAAFLAPMYPQLNLYDGSNLYFHLLVPLVAMVEFILMEVKEEISFRYTLIAAACSLIYGLGYYINIVKNGIGEWPDTNDWYGFLNWGYPIGFVIFGFIILMNWGMACLLRFLNKLIGKVFEKEVN